MSEPRGILERIEADQVRIVDFRFTDLTGTWRHLARNAASVGEHCLADGIMVDGSAVPGWRDVTEADLRPRPDLDTAYVEPRNDVERTLVGFWQELLGVSRVGVEDSFFDLGGHSLIAVRLFAMVKKAWRVDFPISVLFEAPTVAVRTTSVLCTSLSV